MSDSYPFLKYKQCVNLAEYLKDLRIYLFKTQQEAANCFHLHRTTISRYENEDNPLIPPEVDYVAGLLKLNVEKVEREQPEKGANYIDLIQQEALNEVNQIIRDYYPHTSKIKDWNRLCQHAEIYLANHSATPIAPPLEWRPYYYWPASPPVFIGRDPDFARVLEGLNSGWQIIEIVGIPGIGKTALVIKVANYCSSSKCTDITYPFHAVVWVSARGRPEQKYWFEEVLFRIAQEMKADYILEQSLDQKQATVQQLLHKYRILVILDNYETMAADVKLEEWLHLIPESSKVLLTSREKYIQNAWSVHLDGLLDTDAIELIYSLAHVKQLKNVENAKQSSLLSLVKLIGGHPKAIEMALGLVDAGWPLDTVVAQIAQGTKAGASVTDYITQWAWQALATDQDAQAIMKVVSFFTSRITREALTAVSGLTNESFDEVAARLVRLSLLNVEDQFQEVRYSIHPMIRNFISTLPDIDPLWEIQARQRWIAYYLDFLERRIRRKEIAEPYWRYLGGGKLKTIGPEWANLLNVLEWADRQQQHHVLVELMLRLIHYLDRRAYHPVRLEYARKAALAAQVLGLASTEALFRIDGLGVTLRKTGRYQEAEQEIKAGLQCMECLSSEIKEEDQQRALGYAFLAKVYIEQNNLTEASTWMAKATELEGRCIPVIRHRILVTAGDLAYEKGDYENAKQYYWQASDVANAYRTDGDTDLTGVYRKLGFCFVALEMPKEAEKLFKEVISYAGQGGELNDVYATFGMAQVAKLQGEVPSARRRAQNAKKKLSRLTIDHPVLQEIEHFLKTL